MAPLLYWELNRTCPDIVPQSILLNLRERFLCSARRNLLFASELVRLISMFGNEAIDVLAFKGPAISWTLYENPALREMSDLDLLVRPRDARRAYDLLISEGYEPAFPALHWPFLQSYNNEVPLTRGEVAVDLHWKTTPGNFQPRRDAEAAWRRDRRVPLAGGSVPTFSTEDLLLFLSVHGGKHRWTNLRWLTDVARLVTREAIDWQAVLERAQATKSCRPLLVALALLRDVLGVTIPGTAEAMIRDDRVARKLADNVRLVLMERSGRSSGTLSQLRFWLALSASPLAKARVLWQPLQPQIADQLWWRLPVWLSPAYYLIRPVRLIAKYGSALLVRGLRGAE